MGGDSKGADIRVGLIGRPPGVIENQIKRDQLYIVGIPCTGMIDHRAVQRAVEHKDIVSVEEDGDSFTVKGSDFCLLVTEPTPFGLNDLKLTVEMLKQLHIPMGIIINRADVGNKDVYEYCRKENIPILLEIPMDRKIAHLYSEGIPLVEEMLEYRDKFIGLFVWIKEIAEGNRNT